MTKRQLELLTFVRDYPLQHGGVGASYQDMVDGIGLSSKSEVVRILAALERRGYVRRPPAAARAVEVLRMPEGAQ